MFCLRTVLRSLCGFSAAGVSILLMGGVTGVAFSAEQNDTFCIGCHETPGLSTQFPNSEKLSIKINAKSLQSSVHGDQRCTACHPKISKFPHPAKTANDYREFQLEASKQCWGCHKEQAKQEQDSIHGRGLVAGDKNAAICIDCHGSHAVSKANAPRHKISTSCGRCHGAIYEQYIHSAHGRALLEINNPDVPVCTDCHEAHRQADPRTEEFRLQSPQMCAKCHADEKMMRKYNISTEVFNSYVADFHGLTITLFDKQHPNQRINTAVCIDCHGVHDIQKTTDATSTVVKQNLLGTCQRCHPDATANFPDSWVGHFPPTKDRFPLVYWVNVVYKFLIPITIGGMLLFVLIDGGGRVIRRLRKGRV